MKVMQKTAPVYNYHCNSQGHWQISQLTQVRSQKGSNLWEGTDRTGDQILTNKVFHVMHVIPSLKLGDH